MTPRARTSRLDIVEHDGGLLIRDQVSNAEHTLHPLTAFVWKHADGQTAIDVLANRATAALNSPITEDQVWAAVDVLTGARLLEDRIAPPAGAQRVARRDLLRTVAVGSAAAAALGVASTPAIAQSEVKSKESAELKAKNDAQESSKKVAQENAQKQSQEQADKIADARARAEDAKKLQQQAQEDASKAQKQEQVSKKQAQEQDSKSAHEEAGKSAQEERGKNQAPFTDVILEADWANFGEGFAPLSFERRGAHVHLVGVIEFNGEPEYDVDPPEPDGTEIGEQPPPVGDADPPDPDSDEFDMETILIGRLPEGSRPAASLAFTVASDTMIGASEVLITSAGEILLVLDDESDDQLDTALRSFPPGPTKEGGLEKDKGKEGDQSVCVRRLLRRRRRIARAQARQRRKLLRKRAKLARKRCSDGQKVFLTGPSEISFAGISFRAK